jgi:hypothetical protein
MPELDDAQIRTALVALRDSAAREVDPEARLDELHARANRRGAGRRWGVGLLAAVAAVALVAGSVAVFDRGEDHVVTAPAEELDIGHDDGAKAALDRAVRATLEAPGWVAEIVNVVGRTTVTYQAPNRIDSDTTDADGERLSRVVIVGTESWSSDSSGWVPGQRDWRTIAPLTLLDALSSACVATWRSGELAAWDGTDGCDGPLGDALDGTDVWVVALDAAGRLARIDVGELGSDAVDPDTPRAGLNRLGGLPVGARFSVEFRYEDVPEVSVPADAAADDAAARELEDLMIGAFVALGWDRRPCCSHPADTRSAQLAAEVDGVEVPVVGAPVEERTFDHDGAPAVFVQHNDHVVGARPIDLAGAPGVTGTANGYPFAAFTCGGYLWMVGGLFGSDGPPLDDGLVISAATELSGAVACEPGERPVAPGHGDPHG